jgi:hypothetical protein
VSEPHSSNSVFFEKDVSYFALWECISIVHFSSAGYKKNLMIILKRYALIVELGMVMNFLTSTSTTLACREGLLPQGMN